MSIGGGPVVWENGRVALSMNLIFGLVVMSENGWFAVEDLEPDEFRLVWRLVDNDPSCPFLNDLRELMQPSTV